ncbi:MAG: hypothetical protein RR324_06695 [Cellulosilyticaceae bacterium]
MSRLKYKNKQLAKSRTKTPNVTRSRDTVNDKEKIKNSNKTKKKIGLVYKLWLVISFSIIQFIYPIWGEKGVIRMIKAMIQVSVSPVGIIHIDTNRYITRKSGWEQLDKLLKAEGYETHVLFKQCEFWKADGIKKELKGRSIGEFFILWQGDKI